MQKTNHVVNVNRFLATLGWERAESSYHPSTLQIPNPLAAQHLLRPRSALLPQGVFTHTCDSGTSVISVQQEQLYLSVVHERQCGKVL